jgi:hypothetical protein
MEKLLVATRGGLGDQIICNGIVNHWSETHHVILPVRKDFIPSMQCLYMDNPNVEIIECYYLQLGPGHEQEMMEKSQHYNARYISLGTMGVNETVYQESMYEHAGLPFEYRYSKFRFPSEVKNRQGLNNLLAEYAKEPYSLVHRWGSSGPANFHLHVITHPIIEVVAHTNNIFDWIDLILNATEIHCLPSSFFHLVDSILPQVKAKLFYHHARRHTSMNPFNEFNHGRWQWVHYDQRDAL